VGGGVCGAANKKKKDFMNTERSQITVHVNRSENGKTKTNKKKRNPRPGRKTLLMSSNRHKKEMGKRNVQRKDRKNKSN